MTLSSKATDEKSGSSSAANNDDDEDEDEGEPEDMDSYMASGLMDERDEVRLVMPTFKILITLEMLFR